MLRVDWKRQNRDPSEDPFNYDLRLAEKPRAEKSLDRFIPQKVEKRLFSLGPKEIVPLEGLTRPREESVDFNQQLLIRKSNSQFEEILEKNLVLHNKASNQKPAANSERKITLDRKLFCYSTNKKRKNCLHDDDQLIHFDQKPSDFSEKVRKIDCTPSRVLDAPGMEDDFYRQVLEWTPSNILLVALQHNIYSWNPTTNETALLYSTEDKEDKISAIKSDEAGELIAVGTALGSLHLINLTTNKEIKLQNNFGRISCIDFCQNQLAIGCKDRNLVLFDLRTKKETDVLCSFQLQQSEICGVKFSHNGNYLAAGGNDNRFIVIDLKASRLIINSLEHKAAVRAIAWSYKHPQLVASGGGRKDKCINLWNVTTGRLEKKIETDSQVCGISFSKTTDEFLSTHGFSNNNVQVWETHSYTKIAELIGHTERVLYHSLSPDGCTLVTSSADETLRFWDVFPKQHQPALQKSLIFASHIHLR